ncbi:MAG: CRISPR-associated endonuclease Cas1 [Rhodanobacteraceae bacterium]
MLNQQSICEIADESDGTGWAERSHYWLQQAAQPVTRATHRIKRSAPLPLVLTGNGVRLSVDRGALLAHSGFTHHPRQRESWRMFPGDRRNPSRVVIVDGHGSLSLDVSSWLASQAIPLCCVDWRGKVVSVACSRRYSSDEQAVARRRVGQLNGRRRGIVQKLVSEKIANSISTLESALPRSRAVTLATSKLRADGIAVKRSPPATVNGFRGIDGRAAVAYFSAWRSFPLRWTGVGRHPIPED